MVLQAFYGLRQLHIDFDITEFFHCFDDILLQPNVFESMISSLSFIVKSRPKLETFSTGWTRIWSNRNNTRTLEKRLQKAKKIFLDGIRAGCGEGCPIKADIYGNLAYRSSYTVRQRPCILLLHQTFTNINKFFELEMFKIVPLSARLYIVDRCSYNLEPVELSEVLCARVLGPPIKRLRQ